MLDIFDILGPVMIGPSSSHTAGAARIGAMARTLLGAPPVKAAIHLYGSFAETGSGHGTDRALVGGLLGMKPDDPRLPNAFEEAKKAGLTYTIDEIKLRDAHPNSVLIKVWGQGDTAPLEVIGASIGGGRMEIRELSGMKLSFSADVPTLIVRNEDKAGSVADVSYMLSRCNINIGTFQVTRNARGGEAVMVIECDAPLDAALAERIRAMPDILDAVVINP